MPNFWHLPINPISKFNNFLWVCWFLGKSLSNFVPPVWKLYNPYCHSRHRKIYLGLIVKIQCGNIKIMSHIHYTIDVICQKEEKVCCFEIVILAVTNWHWYFFLSFIWKLNKTKTSKSFFITVPHFSFKQLALRE